MLKARREPHSSPGRSKSGSAETVAVAFSSRSRAVGEFSLRTRSLPSALSRLGPVLRCHSGPFARRRQHRHSQRGVEIARLRFVVDKIPKHERDRVRRGLLDYCHRDAMAMVRLVENWEGLALVARWRAPEGGAP
jgi:hypothetical protein